jgi:hypothetical protein
VDLFSPLIICVRMLHTVGASDEGFGVKGIRILVEIFFLSISSVSAPLLRFVKTFFGLGWQVGLP